MSSCASVFVTPWWVAQPINSHAAAPVRSAPAANNDAIRFNMSGCLPLNHELVNADHGGQAGPSPGSGQSVKVRNARTRDSLARVNVYSDGPKVRPIGTRELRNVMVLSCVALADT